MAEPQHFEVRLAKSAEADLRSINEYLSSHTSPAFASQFLDRLMEKIENLEQFPHRGSISFELQALGATEYRQILFRPYRLFYRIVESRVIVTIIADGRRDILALLQQRLVAP